jgi:tetratricopeptide (TPR) repeat protein
VGFALAPTAVRNRVVGGEWFADSASGGLNLYVGNHAAADGTFSAFPADFDARFFDSPKEQHGTGRRVAEQRAGRALSAQEVSSYWSGRAFDVIADNPLRWLRLEARKLLLFVNASEVWNNRSIELSRDFSWVLRLPLPGFGVVAPLGLLGMLLCRARVRELWPLYAAIAVQGLTALLFFVLARYRYPVVPALLLFAAAAGCELWDRARARRARPLATAAAGLASLAILVHLPLVENPLHMAHFNLANRYRAVERWELAADHYWRSVTLAQAYLPAFEQLALTYEDWGKRDEAVRIWQHLRDLATARNADTRAARAEQHLRSLGAPLRDAPTLPGANGLRRDSEPTP